MIRLMQRATLSFLPFISLLVIWSLVINPVFAATSTWIGGAALFLSLTI